MAPPAPSPNPSEGQSSHQPIELAGDSGDEGRSGARKIKTKNILDSTGDLQLITDSRIFQIDSKALIRHSEYWRHKIKDAPSSNHATGGKKITLDLNESNAAALEVVLLIAHGLAVKAPAKPGIRDLQAILVLTNKYEMSKMMSPFAQHWYATVSRPSFADGVGVFHFAELSTAWEYGSRRDFCKVAKDMAWFCCLRQDEQMFHHVPGGKSVSKLADNPFIKQADILREFTPEDNVLQVII